MDEVIEKRTNGFAIAALVFSIIGFAPTLFIPNIIGLILAIVALIKTKKYHSGKAMGIVSIILSVVGAILNVFYFAFLFIYAVLEGILKGLNQ